MHSLVGGLLSGALHALSGPDHIAALLPFSLGKGWGAWRSGAFWGLGHGFGVLLQGLIFYLLATYFLVNLAQLEKWIEVLVGVSLIAIGVFGIYESREAELEHRRIKEAKDGGASVMIEAHAFTMESPSAALTSGIVMGFSSGGHLVGMAPTLSMDFFQVAAFLVAFALGMAVGMSLFTGIVGAVSLSLAQKGSAFPPPHVLSRYVSYGATVLGALLVLHSFAEATLE